MLFAKEITVTPEGINIYKKFKQGTLSSYDITTKYKSYKSNHYYDLCISAIVYDGNEALTYLQIFEPFPDFWWLTRAGNYSAFAGYDKILDYMLPFLISGPRHYSGMFYHLHKYVGQGIDQDVSPSNIVNAKKCIDVINKYTIFFNIRKTQKLHLESEDLRKYFIESRMQYAYTRLCFADYFQIIPHDVIKYLIDFFAKPTHIRCSNVSTERLPIASSRLARE